MEFRRTSGYEPVLLDSDILSLFEKGDPVVTARYATAPPTEVTVSVISVEEMLSGWYTLLRRAKRRDQTVLAYERLASSVEFLATFPVLRFTAAALDRFENLKKARLHVGGQDLRIAAIALEHGATVVTRNVRDFQFIPGLQIEDWSKP